MFASTKYHLRFNEGRKFMELSNININLSKSAENIDNKLKGLKWITPEYYHNVDEELALIKDTMKHLEANNDTIMVLTYYQFLSAVIEKDFMSPNRWFTTDGVSYPLPNNKYFMDYQKYFRDIVMKNNINLIYTIKPIEINVVNIIFEKDCLETKQVNKILYQHKLNKCN